MLPFLLILKQSGQTAITKNSCDEVFPVTLKITIAPQFLQMDKVKYEADKVFEEFTENLQQCTEGAEEFIGGIEMALTLVDDTLAAGFYLRDKSHDTEVLQRFHSVTAEINNRLTDNTMEQTHVIQPVSLCKGGWIEAKVILNIHTQYFFYINIHDNQEQCQYITYIINK